MLALGEREVECPSLRGGRSRSSNVVMIAWEVNPSGSLIQGLSKIDLLDCSGALDFPFLSLASSQRVSAFWGSWVIASMNRLTLSD